MKSRRENMYKTQFVIKPPKNSPNITFQIQTTRENTCKLQANPIQIRQNCEIVVTFIKKQQHNPKNTAKTREKRGRGDGRTDGQTDDCKDGRTDGRMHGWTEGRTDGGTDGPTDRQTDRYR